LLVSPQSDETLIEEIASCSSRPSQKKKAKQKDYVDVLSASCLAFCDAIDCYVYNNKNHECESRPELRVINVHRSASKWMVTRLQHKHSNSLIPIIGLYVAQSRKLDLGTISVKDTNIQWVDVLLYLSVNIASGSMPSFCYDKTKRSFYASLNSIMSRAKSLEQLLQLSLVGSYCLPLLIYAGGVFHFSQRQMHELNVCWNNVFSMIFFFNKWEYVTRFISGLGRLNFVYLIKLARVEYFFHLMQINHYLLYDIFFEYYRERIDFDDCLKLMFCSRSQRYDVFIRNSRLT
jgi:hypothetical protein